MRRRRIALLLITAALILSYFVPISFYPLNRLILGRLGERLGADIECRRLRIHVWRAISAEGIKVLGRGGFGLTADRGRLELRPVSIVTGRLHVRCRLENIKFYRSGTIMRTLSDMLMIEPLGDTEFKYAEADFFVGRDDTLTHRLLISSDRIKIAGSALTGRDDSVFCNLKILLADDIVDGMPPRLKGELVEDEEGPYSSVTLGIMGNYRKPVLRIMTDFYKLDIS